MVIVRARLIPYRLPLRHPWRTATGTLTQRSGWLVELETDGGEHGWGDCAPLPGSGTEDPATARDWLERRLAGLHGRSPAAALADLPGPERSPPAARHGLETALVDLAAQAAGLSVARWLDSASVATVAVNANLGRIGPGTPGTARRARRHGFRVLKLKLGVRPLARELPWLLRLIRTLPPDLRIRLDANQAWSERAALAVLRALAQPGALPPDALEEPVARPRLRSLARLQRACSFPLAADESLVRLAPLRLVAGHAVRRLVLKPGLCGGLLPALALARAATARGAQVVVTSILDSAVGVHAALHLAAALPPPPGPSPRLKATGTPRGPLAHGLATSAWLAADVAPPPPCVRGMMAVPAGPGLGCRPGTTPLR